MEDRANVMDAGEQQGATMNDVGMEEAVLPDAVSVSEAARLLAELNAKVASGTKSRQLPALPLDQITLLPALFQPRAMDERHVSELMRAIKAAGSLDPVTVLQAGEEVILVDGHHRVEAYTRAKRTTDIPVRYFEGTPQEAVLESGQANSKAKLTMATWERMNLAWRLVVMKAYSKEQIATSAGVSTSQVATMRKVLKKLGEGAAAHRSWLLARRAAEGEDIEMSDDEREEWKKEQANRWADRLQKEFGNKLSSNPEITALALATYFGRRLPAIVGELRGHVDEFEEGDEEADF
ncbi:ParB/RepB/Spo0J family partition protein [Methylobacterium sp. CM6257]